MIDEQEPSPEYIRGFNQLYKLKQEAPDVAQQLLSAKATGDRFEGMKAGAKQYELERIREATEKGRDRSREREI